MIRAERMASKFVEVGLNTVPRRSCALSPRDPVVGFCQGTPLRNEIEAPDPSRPVEATNAAAAALPARFDPQPNRGKMQALVITASP